MAYGYGPGEPDGNRNLDPAPGRPTRTTGVLSISGASLERHGRPSRSSGQPRRLRRRHVPVRRVNRRDRHADLTVIGDGDNDPHKIFGQPFTARIDSGVAEFIVTGNLAIPSARITVLGPAAASLVVGGDVTIAPRRSSTSRPKVRPPGRAGPRVARLGVGERPGTAGPGGPVGAAPAVSATTSGMKGIRDPGPCPARVTWEIRGIGPAEADRAASSARRRRGGRLEQPLDPRDRGGRPAQPGEWRGRRGPVGSGGGVRRSRDIWLSRSATITATTAGRVSLPLTSGRPGTEDPAAWRGGLNTCSGRVLGGGSRRRRRRRR